MKNCLLLVLVSLFCCTSITAQTLKTYTGPYPDGRNPNWRGKATYSYTLIPQHYNLTLFISS